MTWPSDLGEICNCFGFKYFSMLYWACLVHWNLFNTKSCLLVILAGLVAPSNISRAKESIWIQSNYVSGLLSTCCPKRIKRVTWSGLVWALICGFCLNRVCYWIWREWVGTRKVEGASEISWIHGRSSPQFTRERGLPVPHVRHQCHWSGTPQRTHRTN